MTSDAIKILQIDNDARRRDRIRGLLDSIPEVRYQLTHVPPGATVQQCLAGDLPDACLVGDPLRAWKSLEVVREIAGHRPARPPVIFVSRSRSPRDREAMAAGADDYLDETTLDAGALDRAVRHAIQRRRVLRQLEEQETHLNLALSAANIGFWHRDLITDAVYLAPETRRLLGYPETDSVLTTHAQWIDAVHADDRLMLDHAMGQLLEAAVPVARFHFRMRTRGGDYQWFQGRAVVVRDDADRPVRLIGTVLDVTERMTTEALVRDQTTLLDQANDIIVIRDLEHHFLYCNESAARSLGFSRAEIQGRTAAEIMDGLPAEYYEAFRQVRERGEWHGELTLNRRDGRTLLVDSRWSLVRDDAGRPRAVLSINTDITEKKQLESQFLRAQRMESIGLLAGGIAHDLNNVLAPIVMGAQLLQLRHPDADTQKILSTVEASAQRGADLVRQVLTFARGLEGGRLLVHPKTLVKDVQKLAAETFGKSIEIGGRIDPNLWPVPGDPTQLHQLLLNLCVNARDAMPHGGRLTITANNARIDEPYAAMTPDLHPGSYVVIEVQDTGTGIPPEIRSHIFEPFFTTKSQGQGMGLGLSTVLTIAKSHDGVVTFTSEVDRGTSFKVYLPASTETALKPAAAEAAIPRGHGETILLVDDEASVLSISSNALEAFGYQVLTASNGAEALALYAQKRASIAVVLTDMAMPVLDGAALIYALRRIDPAVKVIAASGLKSSAQSMEPFGLGATHFLAKPFTADTMLQAVHEAIVGPEDSPPA